MTSWLGTERVELAVCDSTNDEAARLAGQGKRHGTVVIAREQRAGRGRKARSWYSPPGENLYLSVLLRPTMAAVTIPAITLAAGVAVARVVRAAGVAARLDWPNDVVVADRKLAGILTEMSTQGDRVGHVVVGIGVNVDLGSRTFPAELAGRATSLALAGATIARDTFLDSLLDELEVWLDRFFDQGVAGIADAWLELAGLAGAAGHRPRVRVDGREGTVLGIDEHGFLLLADDGGQVHCIVAGDVERIDPHGRHDAGSASKDLAGPGPTGPTGKE